MNHALEVFDRAIIWILVAMMALAIVAATADLVWVFAIGLLSSPFDFLTVTELLDVFGAFLIVLIGLELLATVKSYAKEHRVHVEAVLLVSLIAVLRKLITLDLKTVPPATVLAVAGLVGALAGAYWLMRKSVRGALAQAGAPASTVERFIHGTTIATNAVLEQKGAVTAMLTTEGFEDVLELGRQKRSRMYDLDMDPETPTFVAPRRRRRGIRERLDARGGVLVPLDEEQVRRQVAALQRDGAQAIAVCYLFSFVNPAHERRTREICREVAPEISVSLSSAVDPTFRQYERFCITAFDAYLGPVVKRYLAGLAETLRGLGVPGVPLVMRSRGGLVSAGLAARQPVTLFLSGPAAGVVGARFAAERSDVRDFVSLDMGGTSNDVAVVRGGKPLITSGDRKSVV